MRLSFLPILLAGASVVSLVSAEPIRIGIKSSSTSANIRLGHALANANVNGNDDNVRDMRSQVIESSDNASNSRHFCGASLREKAVRISNAFRHALGMPLIETQNVEVHFINSLPPYSGEDAKALYSEHGVEDHGNDDHHRGKTGHHSEHGKHHRHGHHGGHHKHGKSFLRRIHKAIKALGPWEGRAVAFVLGCGIGVLLRMFWVLSVLTYRTIRGERDEETLEREYILYEQVPETLFATPPAYTDEKVKLATSEETESK